MFSIIFVIYSVLLIQSPVPPPPRPSQKLMKRSGSLIHAHREKCVKFLDNQLLSTWQTDGSSNLSDRHCHSRSDDCCAFVNAYVHLSFYGFLGSIQ